MIVHLANEAKLAGPIHYRWVYPYERYYLSVCYYTPQIQEEHVVFIVHIYVQIGIIHS